MSMRDVARKLRGPEPEPSRGATYATVEDVSPLRARRHDTGELVDGDELLLGQWARRYDARWGIDEGDTLICQPMDDDAVLVVEVLSETDVSEEP